MSDSSPQAPSPSGNMSPAPCGQSADRVATSRPLRPWMWFLLRFAGTFNLLAGAAMISLYHEGFKLIGIPKPQLILPVQIMGVLVGLFGVGYHLVASHPMENRNILVLGFWSKAISSGFVLWYVARGHLPLWFVIVVTLTDVIYLPPFYAILRHLRRVACGAVEDY